MSRLPLVKQVSDTATPVSSEVREVHFQFAFAIYMQHHDRMDMKAGRLAKRGRADERPTGDSVVAFGGLGRVKAGESDLRYARAT